MKKILPYITSIIYLLFGQVERAMAQDEDFGTDVLSGLVTAGGTRDLFDIIVGIVNIVLYFLGGIAILLGLYAGWLWFTSRGNADQIRKAKGIMISAVVGLFIIFASYAITNFVIGNLYRSTIGGSSDTTPSDGGGDSAIVACPPPTDGSMLICSYSSSKPVGGYVTISGWNFDDYVNVSTSKVSIGGVNASLISCNSRIYWNQRYTRDANVYYQIKAIIPEVLTGIPQQIRVDNGTKFATKEGYVVSADALGLNIACFEPDYGPNGETVTVSGINFGTAAGTRSINMIGWLATPLPGAAGQIDVPFTTWDETSITFTVSNNALASWVNITNTESGSGTDKEYFKVTCTNNDDCSSKCCSLSSRECRPFSICSGSASVPIGPYINYVTPDNGVKDNLITIRGSGFGNTLGQVFFTKDTETPIPATLPSDINTSCSDLWTDTEIIIGIPDVVDGDTYLVTVLPSAASVPSNGVSFVANTTRRPGICKADKNSGSFGTPVTITGVNFLAGTGNTVKYGGFEGSSVAITAPFTATSNVPNLASGLVAIQINAGTEISNPYSFGITEAIAGDPNIVNISPENGPTGTYLTINGNNFGTSKGTGKVVFEQGASSIDASFDFPLQCANSVWTSSRIIVKVPVIATVGDYKVKVIRSDAKVSNTKDFAFTTGIPGPGLCAIFPDNGPKNTKVHFYGDNFDTTNSEIKFYNDEKTRGDGTSVWSVNSALWIPVPTDAETGPVVVTSGSKESGAFNFRVGSCGEDRDCASGQTCCKNPIGNYCSATSCSNALQCTYGWSFVTEPTPPPELEVVKHWPACDSSCGNSEIGVGFNLLLEDSATATSATNPNNYQMIDVTDPLKIISITKASLDNNPAALIPATVILEHNAGLLEVGHTYGVTVGTNIKSDPGGQGLESPYYWQFTVKEGSCSFTDVDINLKNYTALRPGQIISYNAAPIANAGACGEQRLTCDVTKGCKYAWSIDTTEIASISTGADAKYMKARSTSAVLPPNLVGTYNVQCTITQDTDVVSSRASLSKDYRAYLLGLRMVAHYPACVGACLNATVGLRFNSQLDDNSVTNIENGTYIKIFDNINLSTPLIGAIKVLSNNPDSESIIEIGHPPFEPGHGYTVTVSNQIKNVFGNSFAGTSWSFSVGTEECVVTAADVLPSSKTSNVGRTFNYTAQTVSDTIACGRIPVDCRACSYAWSLSNVAVASIGPAGKVSPVKTLAIGNTDVNCDISQASVASIPAVKGVLNVVAPDGPTYGIPKIEDYAPEIAAVPQCRNTAVEILFTEKMNLDSLRDNLKLFDASGNLVAGTFTFTIVDGAAYPGPGRNQTKVIFSPTALLNSGETYRVSLGSGVPPVGIVSINGIGLDLTSSPAELQANNWTFVVGTEICQISYVRIDPSEDYFTCGGNSCEGDENTSVNGNQHEYTAVAYSRYGTVLSMAGLDYKWAVSPNPQNIVSLVNDTAPEVAVTAEENGKVAVSVTVDGTSSSTGVDLGSARASLPVTVFLCQNPWPSISNFPWFEKNAIGSKDLNFSTYYCQQFTEDSPSLPYLNYPPALSRNPAIGSDILAEYIFTVKVNSTTAKNSSLGSLAYYLPETPLQKSAVWQRLSSLMKVNKAQGQGLPVLPADINVAVNGNDVTVRWTLPTSWYGTTDFQVQRKLHDSTDWSSLKTIYVDTSITLPNSYLDKSVPNGNYDYRIKTCEVSGTCIDSSLSTVEVSVSAGSETNFIIFRVMPNAGHLSVKEWYKTKFPGEAVGSMTTVDGYEAMKVGNTIYISAANIHESKIYTNIYIIAYSIGANAQTKDIYEQFIANFKLNTNTGFSNINDSNLCDNDIKRSCSIDLDCEEKLGVQGICLSKSLKLRRDVKRLTDLLPVQKYLATYGVSHRACKTNPSLSCTSDDQCGTFGPCISYYPQLSAGTFVPGQTNSKWPSWTQSLAGDLRQSLPVDPINRFTDCGNPVLEGADPATCWKEATREFSCVTDASIYGYKLEDSGRDYQIYSNFEYDPVSTGFGSFASTLVPEGSAGIANLSTTLTGYCSGIPVLPEGETCGNGRIDPDYCSNPIYTTQATCTAGGAQWKTEICDGGINYSQCAVSLGSYPWWNEQVSGCNPRGTPDQCTWYTPTLTPAMCGGYCGDKLLQTTYESCDLSGTGTILRNGVYHCPGVTFPVSDSCNSACNMVCTDGLPAAKCGDRVWTTGREACDPTASPNGLAGWDCPKNGNVICGSLSSANACGLSCDNGETPYQGLCGDGIMQGPEVCDYGDFDIQSPAVADGLPTKYTCSSSCDFVDQAYCGDKILQTSYGETCDTNPLAPVLPNQSRVDKQYECRMTNDAIDPDLTRCTLTTGGYCGDNLRQETYGEFCDGTDPTGRPAPWESSIINKYGCASNCLTGNPAGGYCGDGLIQAPYYICSHLTATNDWERLSFTEKIPCENAGGTWRALEQCDTAVLGEKQVELVFVFDISKSMNAAAFNLCNALDDIISVPTSLPDTTYKMTVMVMGDDAGKLSSGTGDDIATLAPDLGRLPEHQEVFNLLVSNCDAFKNTYSGVNSSVNYANPGDSFRYLSFYDDSSNNISDNVSLSGTDDGITLSSCGDQTTISPGGPLENWGWATKKIIESYDWQEGYQRIVMPVSDEYAWCGGDVSSLSSLKNNENYTGTPSDDILVSIKEAAIDTSVGPKTQVSPVILRYAGASGEALTDTDGRRNQEMGRLLAYDTGGFFSNSYANWNNNIISAIGAAFCDGNADGVLDCSITGDDATSDTTPPTPPSGLSASLSGTTVSLAWIESTDPGGGSVKYVIERRPVLGVFAPVGEAYIESFIDSGLDYSTAYQYRVQAIDAYNNVQATYAGPVNITTGPAPIIILPPTNFAATGGIKKVDLTWTASPSTIIGYSLERGLSVTGPFPTVLSVGNVTAYADTGLADATTYYYRIRARGATFSDYTSPVLSVTTLPADLSAPTVPQNLRVSSVGDKVVNLAWDGSTDPESSPITYVLERYMAPATTFSSLTTIGSLTYSDASLTNGVTYYYQVKARDAVGNISAASNIISAIPDNSSVAPSPPTLLSIAVDAVGKIMNLNWQFSAPGSVVMHYVIERSLSATFSTFSVIGTTIGNTFSDNFSIGGPAQVAVNYYYRVVAVGTAGLRSAAATISALFPDDIAPAPAPSAVSGSFAGTYIALTWTASNDNIGVTQYLIERGTNAAGPFAQIGTSPSTSYNNTGFLPNATYYYQVRAQDAAGNTSAYSAPPVMVVARDTEAPTPAPVLSGTDTDPVITLSWTGTITDNIGVTNYIIRRSNSASGPFALLAGGTPSASPFVDTSAAPGSTYYYQVAAQDAAGNTSAYSNIESATAFSGPGKPIISNINTPTSAVSFTMNSSGGINPRYFTVERADISSPSTFVVIAANVTAAATGGTLYTNSPVLNGTTYYYRVKCTDNAGDISEYSDTAVVTTQDVTAPTVPSPLNFFARPSVSVVGDINLSWNAFTDASGIKGYTIERRINGGGWQRLPTTGTEITTTGVTYTDSLGVPTDSNTYEYQLRAVDNSGYNIVTTWFSTIACNVAYCNQWDADTVINRSLCNNSCNAAQHCCQVCDNGSGVYMGCRVNTAPASCTLYTTAGTCR